MNIKEEIKSLDKNLSEEEIEFVERLCQVLVEIDNYEHDNEYKSGVKLYSGYNYQNKLIEIAREHNGVFGI